MPYEIEFNSKKFSELLQAKQIHEGLSLRTAADHLQIDYNKLWRIHQVKGSAPDSLTFYKCCQWLSIPMEKFFIKIKIPTNGKGN